MSPCSSLAFLAKQCTSDRRIGEKSHVMALIVDFILKEHFVKVKTESNRSHDHCVKFVTGLIMSTDPQIVDLSIKGVKARHEPGRTAAWSA
jgi:hypothetical protein